MKFKEMNRHQQIAFTQIKWAARMIIGGFENSVADGNMNEMPSIQELEEEVYDGIMTTTYGEGFEAYTPVKEVRFAGEEFLREQITKRVKKTLEEE